MFLPVDPQSGLPVYRQIIDQVRRTIVAGDLRPGEKLPSIRELSALLQLNPLTVGKAYGELERSGLIEMRKGMGMYVRLQPEVPRGRHDAAPAGVTQAAQRLVLESAQAGLTRHQTVRTVEDCWRELTQRTAKEERKSR
ncbi:MAG: GntR family transcriptional regulator [Myxococcales bacterium]